MAWSTARAPTKASLMQVPQHSTHYLYITFTITSQHNSVVNSHHPTSRQNTPHLLVDEGLVRHII